MHNLILSLTLLFSSATNALTLEQILGNYAIVSSVDTPYYQVFTNRFDLTAIGAGDNADQRFVYDTTMPWTCFLKESEKVQCTSRNNGIIAAYQFGLDGDKLTDCLFTQQASLVGIAHAFGEDGKARNMVFDCMGQRAAAPSYDDKTKLLTVKGVRYNGWSYDVAVPVLESNVNQKAAIK